MAVQFFQATKDILKVLYPYFNKAFHTRVLSAIKNMKTDMFVTYNGKAIYCHISEDLVANTEKYVSKNLKVMCQGTLYSNMAGLHITEYLNTLLFRVTCIIMMVM